MWLRQGELEGQSDKSTSSHYTSSIVKNVFRVWEVSYSKRCRHNEDKDNDGRHTPGHCEFNYSGVSIRYPRVLLPVSPPVCHSVCVRVYVCVCGGGGRDFYVAFILETPRYNISPSVWLKRFHAACAPPFDNRTRAWNIKHTKRTLEYTNGYITDSQQL